jgi:hypothetical protein
MLLLAQYTSQTSQTVAEGGLGLGAMIAVVCSWQRNRSIRWAILAGILSWIYVLFCLHPNGRRKEMSMSLDPLPPNHALLRTRHGVVVCNRGVPRAGSLSLGR